MSNESDPSTKERILEAAERLFARKGYGGTGLREIVKEAGVSVAMVNYHFGSKEALLEAVLDRFFGEIYQLVQEASSYDDQPMLKLRRYLRAAVTFLRENRDRMRIAITELPHDAPGIVEFKAERVARMRDLMLGQLLPALPAEVRKRARPEIIGPAMFGALNFHFLARPVLERVFGIECDDAFYQNFADELADLFLFGIFGGLIGADRFPGNEAPDA
jgi:AcrR family transcriptional regulator